MMRSFDGSGYHAEYCATDFEWAHELMDPGVYLPAVDRTDAEPSIL